MLLTLVFKMFFRCTRGAPRGDGSGMTCAVDRFQPTAQGACVELVQFSARVSAIGGGLLLLRSVFSCSICVLFGE